MKRLSAVEQMADKVNAFAGSTFARDTKIRKSSDIDFLLDFRQGEKNFDNLVDLGEYLESLLGRKVELLTRESLKSETGKHIISTSEEIRF